MNERLLNERLWTVDDVAGYLGIPKQTLYQWRTRHYGPAGSRIGKYVRYKPEDVKSWVDNHQQVA
jgi:excisionase family DNA binding protein